MADMIRSASDAVFWYIQELTSKIVAETGIPSDRHHLGKIILRSLNEAPDHILQVCKVQKTYTIAGTGYVDEIDGATDEKETFQSVRDRSIRCATALRNLGLKYQDVIVIMAPNHTDIAIPMYASLYLGIIVAGIDMNLGINELQHIFKCCGPKIIFCQRDNAKTVQSTIDLLDMSSQIIVFGENENYLSFRKLLDKYGGETTKDFKPADFDPEDTNALLVSTSGSTGLPKQAALTHKNLIMGCPLIITSHTKFPTPVNMSLVLSPIQWITSTIQFLLGPILRYTRVQTSSTPTQEHVSFLINKYRPDFTFMSPTFLTTLIKAGDRGRCDLSCLKVILLGGSAVPKTLIQEMKTILPNTFVYIGYGMSETTGMILNSISCPIGSIGSPSGFVQYKLADPDTDKEILEPNVAGEMRLMGPTIFKYYYNNPEATAAAFDEDGWFKTGDLIYRNEYHNYYFVDRLKFLLKYKSYQVSPVEIESVIIKHPAVLDVAVTGIPDDECGDLPVAVIIRRNGYNVKAEEIKDLVKVSLADSKQLRGGVIFVTEFPTTPTAKVDRRKIKELAKILKRE